MSNKSNTSNRQSSSPEGSGLSKVAFGLLAIIVVGLLIAFGIGQLTKRNVDVAPTPTILTNAPTQVTQITLEPETKEPIPTSTTGPNPTEEPIPTEELVIPTTTTNPPLIPITIDNVASLAQLEVVKHGGSSADQWIRSLLWLDTKPDLTLLSVSQSDIYNCKIAPNLQLNCTEIEQYGSDYANLFSQIRTRDIDFIDDGNAGLLAAAALDGNLVIWKADFSSTPTFYKNITDGDILSLAWLQDAQNLLIGVAQDPNGLLGFLRRFDTNTGILSRLNTDSSHTTWVMDIDRAPTANEYASVSAGGILMTWNGFQMLSRQPSSQNDRRVIHTVAWSPDNSQLAIGDESGRIILFSSSGTDTPELMSDPIPDPSSPVGSCSSDKESDNVKQFHSDAVIALAWSDKNLLASGSKDGTVLFWDMSSHTAIHCISLDNNENLDIDVTSLEFSHDSNALAVGLSTGQVLMYYVPQN